MTEGEVRPDNLGIPWRWDGERWKRLTPAQAAAWEIRPLYSCGVPECGQEVSFPAQELHWVDDGVDRDEGFYCHECIISSGAEEVGTSLADALTSIGLSPPCRSRDPRQHGLP